MRDVRSTDALARVRLSPLRGRDDTVHLVPAAGRQLASAELEAVLGRLIDDGVIAVRTSALDDHEAAPFVDLGFVERGRLALMSCPLTRSARSRDPRLRRGRPRDYESVLTLDHRCFPDLWRFDDALLDDALVATPTSRFRVADATGILGYAITGVAGTTGYLQRLAVDTDQQRQGLGRSLVDDGRQWATRRGATTMMVNTAVDNQPAIDFYLAVGFTRRPTDLRVMERRLDG